MAGKCWGVEEEEESVEEEEREDHVVESQRILCKQKDACTVTGGLQCGAPHKVGGPSSWPVGSCLLLGDNASFWGRDCLVEFGV